jgi:lipopolysaccharide/colanic/teichoic acid biosynthesis glycosyltransferase
LGRVILASIMRRNIIISPYHKSLLKRFFDIGFSLLILLAMSPLLLLIGIVNWIANGRPVFFKQHRTGKNGKVFKIIKFRTMVIDAESQLKKYIKLNESDGPAFKIKNDPRFTAIGKMLSKSGMDELPQFINVLMGDMSIVGPRPLPTRESKKLSKIFKIREAVKPGITSPWVVKGAHEMKFKQWMELDRKYVEDASFFEDLKIIVKTTAVVLK